MPISIQDLYRFRDNGLCSDGLDDAEELLGDETFPSFTVMAKIYYDDGGEVDDILRAAVLLAWPKTIDLWCVGEHAIELIKKVWPLLMTEAYPNAWLHAAKTLNDIQWMVVRDQGVHSGFTHFMDLLSSIRVYAKARNVLSDLVIHDRERREFAACTANVALAALAASEDLRKTQDYLLALACELVDGEEYGESA